MSRFARTALVKTLRLGCRTRSRIKAKIYTLSPLPGGEGQGEGGQQTIHIQIIKKYEKPVL
jgi:hypothetical protein